ncbi:heavy metal translocating P-type ATPase [Hyphococcus lacteus]|uniref:Heavy metal translocating P-type ATPase n=1 Tax=Hyphococcus lacteus TaxID=3143536 RepID=A0ABV3Z8Q5_9PROT
MNQTDTAGEELLLASREIDDDLFQTVLSAPGIKCAGCIDKIESGITKIPNVVRTRVNLSTKRVTVDWKKSNNAPPLIDALGQLGFQAHLSNCDTKPSDNELRTLIRALAVAGFGAANIMMLSVGVWAGADEETRTLFHWISAFIALPVMVFSGKIFFSSAWSALKSGGTNMDVPISAGVIITFTMSLYDTITGGQHAYFDAATSLLFFLLIGRTLDYVVRARAHSAIDGLRKLAPEGAAVIQPDGSTRYSPIEQIQPGMEMRIPAGARIPVNGTITDGRSDIDHSVINGESEPRSTHIGDTVLAGALNLTGPIVIKASSTSNTSFISDMIRLMESAETSRHGYQRIADRVSKLYTPVVHIGAVLAFLLWFLIDGNAHHALTVAVSVLIITCPCALGLATPMVQVIAAQRLYRNGILIKGGTALEKLADIDSVIFDKTGTLTEGSPHLTNCGTVDERTLRLAASIAAHSSHPYSKALAQSIPPPMQVQFKTNQFTEHPGDGIESKIDGAVYRLGRAGWASGDAESRDHKHYSTVIFGVSGRTLATFKFIDGLKPSASDALKELKNNNLSIEILSGDRKGPVAEVAALLGGVPYFANLRPQAKLAHITKQAARGHKVLMVGDGINDAPALAGAYVSMAPGNAADIGRTAADIIFLNNGLEAVTTTYLTARNAKTLIRQNIAFAILYNGVAIPLAFLGFITPLIAAIAMSTSSIVVVLNSLRLGMGEQKQLVKTIKNKNVARTPTQYHGAA